MSLRSVRPSQGMPSDCSRSLQSEEVVKEESLGCSRLRLVGYGVIVFGAWMMFDLVVTKVIVPVLTWTSVFAWQVAYRHSMCAFKMFSVLFEKDRPE